MSEADAKNGLIINSPFKEPNKHYSYDVSAKSLKLVEGRRPASYVVLRSDSVNEVGETIPLELANRVREKVAKWREYDYPGVTKVTKDLLFHWKEKEEGSHNRLFFCQVEAIETLIFLNEAPESERLGLNIPPSGGDFQRLCAKMATGTGKTIVMAMVIAWQVINKVANANDKRFSKYVLLIAPGLTVKQRLEVLSLPFKEEAESYYLEFDLVPTQLRPYLSQGVVKIINRHMLAWESSEKLKAKKGVVKMPELSDGAYVSQLFGKQYKSRKNWIVINDEAHHAWYIEGSRTDGTTKAERDESTQWVRGLDRIHKANRILHCFDFTATPYAPTNAKNVQTELFGWVVSDFGLTDAIESGLVKTPRTAVSTSAGYTLGPSQFRHIYPEVKDDLNRKAAADEPLPQRVVEAYHLLGRDYKETYDHWMASYDDNDARIPPVQITVANRTETAKRVARLFQKGSIPVEALSNEDNILHIDSTVLKKAEQQSESPASDNKKTPGNAKERQELLRKQVDTVGKTGQPGEQMTNIVSVMMLSEGWDARNVTQIMGLRAFTSQLLCEQVIGRGLRRRSYDLNPETEMFDPEYVTVLGVPFSLLPSVDSPDPLPKPTVATKEVKVLPERNELEITWPNVVRIDEELQTTLNLNLEEMGTFLIDYEPTTHLDLGFTIDGKIDKQQIAEIDLRKSVSEYRLQRSIFKIVQDLYTQKRPSWQGFAPILITRLIHLTEVFIRSKKLAFSPDFLDPELDKDFIAHKLAIALTVPRIVEHLWEYISEKNTTTYQLELEPFRPDSSTAHMTTWYTAKPVYDTTKSHINRCVSDSGWEQDVARILDSSDEVAAWFKNTARIGFRVAYRYKGASRYYLPDFIVRLKSGDHLVIEVKGIETDQDKAKFKELERWCAAVTANQQYGKWCAEIVYSVEETWQKLRKHALNSG